MKLSSAVKHFGTQAEIAKKLGITEAAVSKWNDNSGLIPIKKALELQGISEGELDLQLSDYR